MSGKISFASIYVQFLTKVIINFYKSYFLPKINFWKSYMSRLQFRLVEETEHPERNLIVKGILDIIFDNISLFRIVYLRCLSGTDI